ncbi:hypothetical protein, conserved [Angomonas deanei]|uniref:Leucine Rich repeat n=1 Tax=Angomonas deanei TaxID=59799 RepID=A0A7G2CWA6_9TRYP|nr:hypothetical protein, conserved [Angomonas deanei]
MLTFLRGLSGLPRLTTASAASSGDRAIGKLTGRPALSSVNFADCKMLTSLKGLSAQPNLKTLDASGAGIPRDEPPGGCPALRSLPFGHLEFLWNLPDEFGTSEYEFLLETPQGVDRCPHVRCISRSGHVFPGNIYEVCADIKFN